MKPFIKYITPIICFFLFPFFAFAQKDMDKIKQLKVKIVLEEMHLDNSKENKFLPLYKQYSEESWKVRKQLKELESSNKDAKNKIAERDNLKGELLSIERKYKDIFLRIISANELEKMYKGEEKFRKTLLELRK